MLCAWSHMRLLRLSSQLLLQDLVWLLKGMLGSGEISRSACGSERQNRSPRAWLKRGLCIQSQAHSTAASTQHKLTMFRAR